MTDKTTRKEIEEGCKETMKKPVIVLQLNYKSGISVKLTVHSFEVSGGTWSWETVTSTIADKFDTPERVITIGGEHVESVFQLESYCNCEEFLGLEEFVNDQVRLHENAGTLKD